MATALSSTGTLSTRSIDTLSLSDEILDKLKVLDYENQFCKPRNLNPVGRYYFSLPGKPTEVFPYFSSLCCWLLKQIIPNLEEWSEFDDLTQTCNTILRHLRQLRMDDPLVTLVKLRQIAPETICLVLDFLCTQALSAKDFHVRSVSYATGAYAEEAAVDTLAEEIEVAEDVVDEDVLVADPMAHHLLPSSLPTTRDPLASASHPLSTLNTGGLGLHASAEDVLAAVPRGVRGASSDERALTMPSGSAEQWLIHLESMLPKLQFKPGDGTGIDDGRGGGSLGTASNKEWRTRLEQTIRQRKVIQETIRDTTSLLDKIGKQLKQATERIQAREAHINAEAQQSSLPSSSSSDSSSSGAGVGTRVKDARLKLAVLRNESERLGNSIAQLADKLSTQMQVLADMKVALKTKTGAMTDTTPLRKLQAALDTVKKDIDLMELRVGVLSQTLVQAHVREMAAKSRAEALARVSSAGMKGGNTFSLSKRL